MGPFTLFSHGIMDGGAKGLSVPRCGLPGLSDKTGGSPPPPPPPGSPNLDYSKNTNSQYAVLLLPW